MIDKNIRLVPQKVQAVDFTVEDLAEAPDSFFLEINAIDVLEATDDPELLDKICAKVRKGGKLVLNGVDGLDVCRQVYFGLLSLPDASQNFFKRVFNLYSVGVLKEYFINKKWDIQFVGLKDGRYLIEAIKP